MAAKKPEILRMDPQEMRGFASVVYEAAEALGKMQIDPALRGGSVACQGTDLESGLARRAEEQHAVVRSMSETLDVAGEKIVAAIEAFVRIDSGLPATAPTFSA